MSTVQKTKLTPEQTKAATTLSRTAPSDPPSAVELTADIDFAEMDMTDAEYWLKKNDVEYDESMSYRWCNTDPRIMPKRQRVGWQPIEPTIRRGPDVILCFRPMAMTNTEREKIQRVTKEREGTPMAKFEQDVHNENTSGKFGVL